MRAATFPDDLASGVYALRLRAGEFEDHTPFFVRAAPGRESAVALVLPTASYMAYGNEHLATAAPMGQAIVGHTPALQPLDLLLMEHPELGLSMYELHSDGSGVAFSSRRRPILNMRPRHRFSFLGTWQFPATCTSSTGSSTAAPGTTCSPTRTSTGRASRRCARTAR